MGQTVVGVERSELLPVVATHAPPDSAEPQVVAPILEDAPDLVVSQPIGLGEGGENRSIVAVHPLSHRGEPKTTVAILEYHTHGTVAQSGSGKTGKRCIFGSLYIAATKSAPGPHPQLAVAVLQQGCH